MTWFLVPTLALANPEPVKAALDQIDATPEQRALAADRLQGLAADAEVWRAEGQAVRQRVLDALFGANVDREALEAARDELVALVDEITAEAFGALADVSEALSVEQRVELRRLREERMTERRAQLRALLGR